MGNPSFDPASINTALVEQLIARQFPDWEALPVTPVGNSGWDNRTFHLGDAMSVRLPSGAPYANAVHKEQRWLKHFAGALPQPIPIPLGQGQPDPELGYPFPWSVNRWLPGEIATLDRITSLPDFAADIATFLLALQRLPVPTTGADELAPSLRGGPLNALDAAVAAAIGDLGSQINTQAAKEIWQAAQGSEDQTTPVWVHGDVAAGNLLVANGQLCGVIDFGQLTIGDPACDLVIAWTFLDQPSRQRLRETLNVSQSLWNRGKGWALWKALIIRAGHIKSNALETLAAPRVLEALFRDY